MYIQPYIYVVVSVVSGEDECVILYIWYCVELIEKLFSLNLSESYISKNVRVACNGSCSTQLDKSPFNLIRIGKKNLSSK